MHESIFILSSSTTCKREINRLLACTFNERSKVMIRLIEWKCVEVGHHRKIAGLIAEYQREGWSLHTYQATGQATQVIHYLLFRREIGRAQGKSKDG